MRINELLILVLLIFTTKVMALPTANVILKVVDQDGAIVENAKASVEFNKSLERGKGWGESSNSIDVKTDSNGMAVFSGTTTPHIYYGASKEGYYSSSYHLEYSEVDGVMGFRNYLPDNPILTVILKRKKNPIGLYAIRFQSRKVLNLPKKKCKSRF